MNPNNLFIKEERAGQHLSEASPFIFWDVVESACTTVDSGWRQVRKKKSRAGRLQWTEPSPFPVPWCASHPSPGWERGKPLRPFQNLQEQRLNSTKGPEGKEALTAKLKKKKKNKGRLETWQFVGWLYSTRWYQVWFLLADGYREKVVIWSGSDWACTEERNSWSLTHP